ncbi:MAG: DUF1592 domain-containing protein [Nannocystaceae bacterium]
MKGCHSDRQRTRSRPSQAVTFGLACALISSLACNLGHRDDAELAASNGVPADDEGQDTNAADEQEEVESSADVCEDGGRDIPGPRLLRRLTAREFSATIRDVFQLDDDSWSSVVLPPDPAARNGFTNNANRLRINDSYADALLSVAKSVATSVSAADQLGQLLPCADVGDRACAVAYIEQYGRRLYRRPLSAEERTAYLDLYDKISAGATFETWVHWATVAMIQSPHTMYRSELGELGDGGLYELSAYEKASALAYTFTGRPPTDALLDDAAVGKLDSTDAIREVAHGLVTSSPDFRPQVLLFARQWLALTPLANLQKDATVFPNFGPDVRTSMITEAELLVWSVINDGNSSARDLFDWEYTYVDKTLADYYGFGESSGDAFKKVERPASWGAGLLGLGSVLAVTGNNIDTSPTIRGHLVRTKFLCTAPPPPPEAVVIPEPSPTETTRERYEMHVSDPSCSTCHMLMDPIGFGLEHLDAGGRYRDKEGIFNIDASGVIVGTSLGDIQFDGAHELAGHLAALPEASRCVAAYLASFTYGVGHENAACMVDTPANQLAEGGDTLIDFYVELTQTPHFHRRSAN